MGYNIDFEIAALLFEATFIVFFAIKRFLPTVQNRLYIVACMMSLVAVVLDIATAFLNCNAAAIPHVFIYFVNTIYFCLVPALTFVFCLYCIYMAKQEALIHTPLIVVISIPLVISELLSLTNPLTGLIYYFENNVYMHGEWYPFEFIANGIYIVCIMAIMAISRNKITKIQFISTVVSCVLLSMGAILQGTLFGDVLLTNAFVSLAMVVTYLSLQNPDMFIDRTSNMFNSDAFHEISTESIKLGKDFSIVYFLIDDYKNLDALYGTSNVNVAMKSVTEYISEIFADYTVYRMDVDTFIIQEMGKGDFEQIHRTLRNGFTKPFKGDDINVSFTISTVILPYWHVPNDYTKLIRIFDFCKSLARRSGYGSSVDVTDALIKDMEYEKGVERAVERAVANNSVQIYCQPIFSTVDQSITSAEALARLFDEELGFISPEAFIRKAEDNGSIVKLGSQIFEKICQFLKDSSVTECGLKSIHINLSPVQCMQENLVQELIEITDRYGIERNIIDLEITETAGVDNNKTIRKNMDDLINERFSFSLDDYGTGYSNTATIVSLPFKAVKIDKSLVWGYFKKQSDILPDIINMFHNQKLELIMEGVETKEMVEVLSEFGCQYLQGFYYSKPIPQREFISYLREFNRKK